MGLLATFGYCLHHARYDENFLPTPVYRAFKSLPLVAIHERAAYRSIAHKTR